jgi:translation initiation factor IF-2
MMIAIKASTEVMTPKMMVLVESELDSEIVEAMTEFVAGKGWMVEVVLSVGIIAVEDCLVCGSVVLC